MTEGILPKTFHCRRCHKDPPFDSSIPHYKKCLVSQIRAGETCSPTIEPIDQPRTSTVRLKVECRAGRFWNLPIT